MFVPIGSALAAGKAFDFRADILLILGGAFLLFALFIAPTVMHLALSRRTKEVLLAIAALLVTYGIVLTVMRSVWTPFTAKFTLPKIGWAGVFGIAIAFDLTAAVLAYFVLRKMRVPVASDVPEFAPQPSPVPAFKP
jgi:putative copper export protein